MHESLILFCKICLEFKTIQTWLVLTQGSSSLKLFIQMTVLHQITFFFSLISKHDINKSDIVALEYKNEMSSYTSYSNVHIK